MIKTSLYNDFSSYDYKQISNEEFMFQEFENFVKNGGDLNLSVNKSSEEIKITPFENFIRENFSVDFFDKLVKNKMIDNPFDFILDKTNNIIKEHPVYSLDWMRKNFETYEKQILKSIEKICDDLKNTTNLSYEQKDYLNIPNSQNILFYIAKNLNHNPKVWKILLEKNKEVKEYIKKDGIFNNIMKSNYAENSMSIKMIFYRHEILNNYFKDNSEELHPFIKRCIGGNEVNLIEKLSKEFNLKEIEKEQHHYDSFVKSSITAEMAKKLLDNDCFFYGKWTGGNLRNSIDGDLSHCFDGNMNFETLDSILNHSKTPKNFVLNNPKLFFETFFNNKANYSTMQFLIKNHQFPIEDFDFSAIAYHLTKRTNLSTETEPLKWFISHGSDPRNCSNLIPVIVSARDEGLKTLRKYAKDGLLDPFSADITYAMLGQDVTKIFVSYYEKLSKEQLSNYTKNGKPAWWGCTGESFFGSIKRKIGNFNQLSLDKKSWVFEIVERYSNKNSSLELKYLSYAYNKIKLNSDKFSAMGHGLKGNNILHNLLRIEQHMKTIVDENFVNLIFQSSEANWAALINEKNNDGKYPLEDCLYIEKSGKRVVNSESNFILSTLMKQLGADFPFEQEINKQSLLEYLKNNFKEELYQKTYEDYKSKKFAEKMDLKLEDKRGDFKTKKI